MTKIPGASRVLIVEDELPISDIVEFALRRGGFETRSTRSLAEARAVLSRDTIHMVVLDLALPDGDGIDLCRNLRATSHLPVLILSSRDEEADRVLGLEIGADDYMVKPFSPRELVARVRGILRRVDGGVGASATGAHGEALRAGRITLNIAEHRVLLDEREVSLTPTEFALLRTLLSSTSRVFTRDLLIAQAYDGNTFVSDRTIDSHVKGVRRKFARLEETADPIETVFGVGYRARELS